MRSHSRRGAALLAALTWLCLSASCRFANYEAVEGSGVVKTEEREVQGFTKIQLDGVGIVVVSQGGRESLSVIADDNILPLLISEVEDGTLHLRVKDDANLNPSQAIKFTVEAKSLDGLTLNGAGGIRASGIQGQRLTAALNGVGDIFAAGSVETLEASVNGTGTFHGEKLIAEKARVQLNGTGDVRVHATETLDIVLSGTGSVTHSGGATVTESNTGTGDIRKGN